MFELHKSCKQARNPTPSEYAVSSIHCRAEHMLQISSDGHAMMDGKRKKEAVVRKGHWPSYVLSDTEGRSNL